MVVDDYKDIVCSRYGREVAQMNSAIVTVSAQDKTREKPIVERGSGSFSLSTQMTPHLYA